MDNFLKIVKAMKIRLTEREQSVVALAMAVLQDKGLDAMKQQICIQVDQSFSRRPVSGQPLLATNCMIPNGKYVVSGSSCFRLLTAMEMCALQGIGPEDCYRLGLDKLPSKTLQSMAGNASSDGIVTFCSDMRVCCNWHSSSNSD